MARLTLEEEDLLMKLNNHDVKKIDFEVTSQGIAYPSIGEITEEYHPIIFRQLLRSLAEKGLLKETGHQMLIFCPKCDSIEVYTKYQCPNCKSTDIARQDFIEHPHCGYIDQKDKFEKGLRYVCPNCDTDLGPIEEEPQETGKESYNVLGSSFICHSCGHNFEKPNITHQCLNCGATFNVKQSRYQKISSYQKTMKATGISPENRLNQIRNQIKDILEERDIRVSINAILMGESEGKHQFDIIGRTKRRFLLGDISIEGRSEDITNLLGKKTDVHARAQRPVSTFLIDLTENPEIQRLGKVYNITIIPYDQQLPEKFNQYLDKVLEK
ncbi:MAG: hypothetical protein ACOC6G_01715 [Thermoproteota archaeon]